MDIKLFAILHFVLNRNIDINRYEDRLIIQKLTYLLQKAGLDFGYSFNWYVRGPYSPPLACDAFEFYQNKKEKDDQEFSPKENKIIKNIKDTFNGFIGNSDKLELVASLLFLKDEKKMPVYDTTLIPLLKSLKPWFSENEIKDAINKINNSELFKT